MTLFYECLYIYYTGVSHDMWENELLEVFVLIVLLFTNYLLHESQTNLVGAEGNAFFFPEDNFWV